MVTEVNKLIANALLTHRRVVIPGVGTLSVVRCGAERLSRRRIAPPHYEVRFGAEQEGETLVTLIARAASCDGAEAQDIFDRWLQKSYAEGVLTLPGIGTVRSGGFRAEVPFEARLNPVREPAILKPLLRAGVAVSVTVGVVVALSVGAYMWLGTSSRSATVPMTRIEPAQRSEDPAVAEHVPAASVAAEPDASGPAAIEGQPDPAASEIAPPTSDGGVRPSVAESPAAVGAAPEGRTRTGWYYVVLGVFTTEQNAERCRAEFAARYAELQPSVHPFGEKFMVAAFAAQDEAACRAFQREHRADLPDLWLYSRK